MCETICILFLFKFKKWRLPFLEKIMSMEQNWQILCKWALLCLWPWEQTKDQQKVFLFHFRFQYVVIKRNQAIFKYFNYLFNPRHLQHFENIPCCCPQISKRCLMHVSMTNFKFICFLSFFYLFFHFFHFLLFF